MPSVLYLAPSGLLSFPGGVVRPEPLRGRGGLVRPFNGRVYSGLGSGAVVRLLVRGVSPLKDTPGRRARP